MFTMDGDKDTSSSSKDITDNSKKGRVFEKCDNCPDYVLPEKIQFNDDFCCESYVRRAISDFCNTQYHPF